ncbi:MAG TPA: TlpA family protein disulfide reductase [Chloroflexia bacterium]
MAELQVSTLNLSLPPGPSGSRVTINCNVMGHFIPSPGSPEMPEFIHGDVAATVNLDRVVTPGIGELIDVRLSDLAVGDVTFRPDVALPLPEDQELRANAVVRNFLKTGFEPVTLSFRLPEGIHGMQIKTVPDGTPSAMNLLLNLQTRAMVGVTPAELFVRNDFAVAVGLDFLVRTLRDAANAAVTAGTFSPNFRVVWGPWDLVSYDVSIDLNSLNLSLGDFTLPGGARVNGVVRLTINGHARQTSFIGLGSSDFTVTQFFGVECGGEVSLDVRGNTALSMTNPLLNVFSGLFSGGLAEQRDSIREQVNRQMRAMMGRMNLGAILGDSLNIAVSGTTLTGCEVRPGGLILHHTIRLGNLGAPRATFRHGSYLPITHEVQLNALNSWIPGGTVTEYRWVFSASEISTDAHRFVKKAPEDRDSLAQWCLRVSGTRAGSAGGTTTVSSANCRIAYFPFLDPLWMLQDEFIVPVRGCFDPTTRTALLDISRPGVGQAYGGSNVVLNFTDPQYGADLSRTGQVLAEALSKSSKTGSALAIVAVLPSGQWEKAQPPSLQVENTTLILTEDYTGGWSRAFGVKEVPATYLVNPAGQIVWHQVGPLDADTLSQALSQHLVEGGKISWQTPRLAVSEGQPAPDFLFEYSPGRQLALRKLRGRAVLLAFWTSWSAPSLDELLYLQQAHKKLSDDGTVILAINDGEVPEIARAVFKEHDFDFPLITDIDRRISKAYGITCWPTSVFLDEAGQVSGSHFGITPQDEAFLLSQAKLKATQ